MEIARFLCHKSQPTAIILLLRCLYYVAVASIDDENSERAESPKLPDTKCVGSFSTLARIIHIFALVAHQSFELISAHVVPIFMSLLMHDKRELLPMLFVRNEVT